MESDRRGCLTDSHLVVCFVKELAEGDLRQKIGLNLNRKTYREFFLRYVKNC